MEQHGEKCKPYVKIYQRTFHDIAENEQQVEKWLAKYGGTEGEDWQIEYRWRYYISSGWDQSDVMSVGDIVVEIFNPSLAFQFEIFKVGGNQRDRKTPTQEELDIEYEYMCDHQKDDNPVWLDPHM